MGNSKLGRALALIMALIMLLCPALAEENTDATALKAELDAANARIAELEASVLALQTELDGYRNPNVVARYDGGVVLFEEVMKQFESICELYKLFYDVDLTEDAENCLSVQTDIITDIAREAIIRDQLLKQGIVLLSEADLASIQTKAEKAWNDIVKDNLPYYQTDGVSYEDAYQQVLEYLEYIGYTHDSIVNEYTVNAENDAMIQAVAGDVEVTKEQVEKTYQSLVATDQSLYAEDLDEFEYAMIYGGDDALITWMPEGFRVIRQLLIPFNDEQLNAYDELSYSLYLTSDETEIAAIRDKMDALYAQIQPAADAALARLNAGEAFSSVMASNDAGSSLIVSSLSPNGSCIHAGSIYYDEPIVTAAMALTTIGEYTQPVKGYYGLYIIEYAGDLTPGEVPLESIYDRVYEETLRALKEDKYNKTVEQWMADANIQYFTERLN